MDKFDEMIKSAKSNYTPNVEAIQKVMVEIDRLPAKRLRRKSFSMLSAAAAVALLIGGVSGIYFAQNTSDGQVISQGSDDQKIDSGKQTVQPTKPTQVSADPAKSPNFESSKIATEIQAAIALIDSELALGYENLSLDDLDQ